MKKTICMIILVLIFLLLLGLFGFSAWHVYQIYNEYHDAESSYSELDKYISISPSEEQDISPEETESSNSDEETNVATEPFSEIIWPTIDFASLQQVNQDVVAWIYIEGTEISYPVVQGADNDYYLNHMFDKTYNSSGCIFLDANGSSDFSSFNNVLHGHHMKNGSMFAGLVDYKEQSYYDEHPIGLLMTPEQNYVIQFFSGYVSKSDGNAWDNHFSSVEFQNWLDYVSMKSWFRSDILPTVEDRILTLSTCSYEFDDARYVLHGIMIPVEN